MAPHAEVEQTFQSSASTFTSRQEIKSNFARVQLKCSRTRRGGANHEWEMSHMNMFKRFLKDESGATAIEYGLIAALIAVAIISVVTAVGTNLEATFGEVRDNLTAGGGN